MSVDRLKKLMMLTTSDNDHEALTALRMANKIIKDSGVIWADVITHGVREKQKAKPQAKAQGFGFAGVVNDDVDIEDLMNAFMRGDFKFKF